MKKLNKKLFLEQSSSGGLDSGNSGGGGLDSGNSGGGGLDSGRRTNRTVFRWNDVTEDTLKECKKNIKKGDRGDFVGKIQERLKIHGFSDFSKNQTPDNKFGALTENMVKEFQKKYGINPLGQVGCITWSKLKMEPSELKQTATPTTSQPPKKVTISDFGKEIMILPDLNFN